MAEEKKVLIVEDDKFLCKMLGDKLAQVGFSVLEAYDGEEALRMAQDERPALILLDIVMPIMDGVTMLKKLRESVEGREIQVIILTNLGDSDDVENAVKEGVHDYLVKTQWLPDDLVKKVKERFSR